MGLFVRNGFDVFFRRLFGLDMRDRLGASETGYEKKKVVSTDEEKRRKKKKMLAAKGTVLSITSCGIPSRVTCNELVPEYRGIHVHPVDRTQKLSLIHI